MRFSRHLLSLVILVCAVFCAAHSAMGQTETATVSGLIVDNSGAIVRGAAVELHNMQQGTSSTALTNDAGIYVFASVQPGQYSVTVRMQGFKQVDLVGMVANVQDHIEQNFKLEVGSVSESVTVSGAGVSINTTDGSVSTVVDRQFAENLPLNGRSFQSLIQLTPGVVLTPNTGEDDGQFSINGQRATGNYWTVDGVAANIGIGSTYGPGNGLGGSIQSFGVTGGTNGLVSVDALQEFRIQTSTYAPEFGRTPGGQISIVTRSGTNKFHGTLFDYLRNDKFDANNWFNGYVNSPPLSKAEERQNDFGGTVNGPLFKDRSFFFFSYEGLRLRLPTTFITTVPDLLARQNAAPGMQPFLNAFPLPNGPDTVATGTAQFASSYSNPSTLDAYSLRLDQKLNSKLSLFGRYDHSPSNSTQRGGQVIALSSLSKSAINTDTATLGLTWLASPAATNDLRFNFSKTDASSSSYLDSFGGAVPTSAFPYPAGFSGANSSAEIRILSLTSGEYNVGVSGHNTQRQFNVVDSLSLLKGKHTFKFGVDLRLLSPQFAPPPYSEQVLFQTVSTAMVGTIRRGAVVADVPATLFFPDIGVYAQDTWHVIPRLNVTYGVRWDIEPPPSSLDGPALPALANVNLGNLSTVSLAPAGTAPFSTRFSNIAPRIGVAFQLPGNMRWQRVFRGGVGAFYDLATSEIGNGFQAGYPYTARRSITGTYPLSGAALAPPSITVGQLATGYFAGVDPNINLPRTWEWNIALEQSLGKQQTLSLSYVGAAGRKLIQSAVLFSPNPTFEELSLVTNAATSDYDALQAQFQRQLSNGLQVLASYTWSHSIDSASAGSTGNPSNTLAPGVGNRGSSDFDIRHAFSAGITYDIPAPKGNWIARAALSEWSLDSVIQTHSAPPVDISDGNAFGLDSLPNDSVAIRPDAVPGVPFYLYGSQYPGRKAFNVAAFQDPPTDPNTGLVLRNGDLGRNHLRGFGATQVDLGVHRTFGISELLKLQFRAEMFNILNHPNFGQPSGSWPFAGFGLSTQMLGQYLAGSLGSQAGAFSPLYQVGGPRSIQFALKLSF
jgi:hypothetical protein